MRLDVKVFKTQCKQSKFVFNRGRKAVRKRKVKSHVSKKKTRVKHKHTQYVETSKGKQK